MSRRTAALLGLAVLATVVPGALAAQNHVIQPPSQVTWGPAPPMLPAGAEIAVLAGDPGKPAPYAVRLKFPAHYDIPAHSHPTDEHVVVTSGALHVGMGDKLDRHASQTLEPGGFVSLPASMRHFAWTTAPTVVQINLEGPFDIFYVNPADNPQKPLTKR